MKISYTDFMNLKRQMALLNTPAIAVFNENHLVIMADDNCLVHDFHNKFEEVALDDNDDLDNNFDELVAELSESIMRSGKVK